ncbi:hypothetical protein TNIN_429711 [Trichonephila inaurata madagascariensis]|uniref:Uncharacterized protein n=1 Tax=Trichonephila inaurata madagascariensis TaxID=2747483 RepID=A0A8X6YWY8_9ARAC|nr:hypothetical protein TNIN_429711 [Trichonephila inaurata madagascariensis]
MEVGSQQFPLLSVPCEMSGEAGAALCSIPVPPPRDHSFLHVTALLPPASLFFRIRQHPPPSIRLSSFASLARASLLALGGQNPRKR